MEQITKDNLERLKTGDLICIKRTEERAFWIDEITSITMPKYNSSEEIKEVYLDSFSVRFKDQSGIITPLEKLVGMFEKGFRILLGTPEEGCLCGYFLDEKEKERYEKIILAVRLSKEER
jgi:hypothetical protein